MHHRSSIRRDVPGCRLSTLQESDAGMSWRNVGLIPSARSPLAICAACPGRDRCTSHQRGRLIYRSFHASYLERVRGYHATPAFQKAMRKRSVWVEPLVAEAKQWHGLAKFRLRGLANVNIQGLLIATGQNLKRWLAKRGWGRRSGPGGSVAGAFRGLAAFGGLL